MVSAVDFTLLRGIFGVLTSYTFNIFRFFSVRQSTNWANICGKSLLRLMCIVILLVHFGSGSLIMESVFELNQKEAGNLYHRAPQTKLVIHRHSCMSECCGLFSALIAEPHLLPFIQVCKNTNEIVKSSRTNTKLQGSQLWHNASLGFQALSLSRPMLSAPESTPFSHFYLQRTRPVRKVNGLMSEISVS